MKKMHVVVGVLREFQDFQRVGRLSFPHKYGFRNCIKTDSESDQSR
jgi:hypothetical protein